MNVNIVCAIDSSYVQHCAVMLYSLHYHNPQASLSVFIIHNGLEEKAKTKLSNFLANFVKNLDFIEINDSLLAKCPLSHHISVATYFRLFIPEVLPQNINKVLFLDSDIVIRKSIIPLWKTDIQTHSHAGVEDPNKEEDKTRLGIPPEFPYFNAGVMLINLDFWRQEQIFTKALQFVEEQNEKIVWWDQDVLNFLLHRHWLPVDPKWNSQGVYFSKAFLGQVKNQGSTTYQTAITDPSIVHFSGITKPWGENCSHPFKEDYHKYLRQTPWAIHPILDFTGRLKAKLKAGIKQKIYR